MSHVAKPQIIQFEVGEVSETFNRQAFRVQHTLEGNPLFEIARLVKLSRALPENRVEFNSGSLPISVDPAATPRNGLTIEQTIKQIETCKSWLVLKQVQADAEYSALLEQCLDDVDQHTRGIAGEMFDRIGFIFVSSPRSVTPFHIDPECNFLLQVHGTKTIYVFDKTDRDLVLESDLEAFYSGGHRNLKLNEELKARARRFDLKPGEGLHVPQHAPHYVENGDSVSISFSITFNVEESDRDRSVYWCNRQLRKLSLNPTPPGSSVTLDRAKHTTFRAIRGAKRMLFGKGVR